MADAEVELGHEKSGKPIMANLLDCSHELLQNILTAVEPADLGALAQTCQSLDVFIRGNKLLCKHLYLQRWDMPDQRVEPDWERQLRDLVRLTKMLESENDEYKRDNLEFAASTIEPLLLQPHSTQNNADFLSKHFQSPRNVDSILAGSSLYAHAGTDQQKTAANAELRQQAAKLHVYYGIPIDHPPLHSFGCPRENRHSTNTNNFRSPYHILYPRAEHPRTIDENSTAAPHFTRSQVRVRYPANNVARARVYDLRSYTSMSHWGPFKADGSMEVDWEKMEAVMVLLGYNLRLFSEKPDGYPALWYGPWEGVTPGSFPPKSEEDKEVVSELLDPKFGLEEETEKEKRFRENDLLDPYGISGTWMRVVCFLDYNDLYAFNFTNTRMDEDQKQGIDTREAIRLIRVKIRVTKVKFPGQRMHDDSDSSSDFDDDESPAHPPIRHHHHRDLADSPMSKSASKKASSALGSAQGDYSDWPVVYFTGTSHSMHASWDPNANSRIRGVVRMTRHGDVRWTTWSIFHGEERWRSEGVQVGGPNSRRGVLGNWFDKDYEARGPVGPTAFWKVSNDVSEDEGAHEMAFAQRFLPFLARYLHGGTNDFGSDDEDDEEEEDFDDDDEDAQGPFEQMLRGGRGDVEIIDEEVEGVEFEIVEETEEIVDDEDGRAHL